MKYKLWATILIVVMVTLACGLPTRSEPTATTAPEPTEPDVPDEEPTEVVQEEEPVDELLVTDLRDADKAVIRIVTQGAYEYGYGSFEQSFTGTGFIIDPSGLAITNNHVVTGAALVQVYFAGDSKAYNAKVLGVSECSDLAVIDIQGDGYPYLKWSEENADRGDEVYSLGYPLGDPEFTQHKGNISKREADIATNWTSVDSLLEHDAIINPGNSGGPLVNENAEVVGVNYAGSSQYDQYYAITRSEALPILEDLQNGDNVTSIGINGEAFITEDGSLSGIWVYSVASGSPADKAGVEPGDIITELEGIILAKDGTMSDYCNILRGKDDDDAVALQVVRAMSGEVLEGQVNGRELEMVSTFTTEQGTGTGTETGTTGDPSTDNAYYVDEFEGELTNWAWFLMNGDEDDFGLYAEDGKLTFDLSGENVWAYLVNEAWIYPDVQIDVYAENKGQNTNNVSLICRYSDDEGWYEFNVFNSGLYKILIFDQRRNEYRVLADGGSQSIRQGKDVNQYTAVCEGDELTLYINGNKIKEVTDKTLDEGLIGISVSSFEYIPVTVEFDWVAVNEP